MIFFTIAHYRNRARNAEQALRDQEAARKSTLEQYTTALLCLDAANRREATLKAEVADLTLQLECALSDVTEAERALDAMSSGLRWFAEGSEA